MSQQIALYIALVLLGMAGGLIIAAPINYRLRSQLDRFTGPRKRDAAGRFTKGGR